LEERTRVCRRLQFAIDPGIWPDITKKKTFKMWISSVGWITRVRVRVRVRIRVRVRVRVRGLGLGG
jgi:hypothetical protein